MTAPDFSSGHQAAAFVEELGWLLAHLYVCAADLSEGQMRVDCNISIGPNILSQGPIVEVKNVNSLRSVRLAVGMMHNDHIPSIPDNNFTPTIELHIVN